MINECDLGGSMTEAECEETCKLQHSLYHDEWEDVQKEDAFDAQLSCITGSTCEELEAGACYDEAVWSY